MLNQNESIVKTSLLKCCQKSDISLANKPAARQLTPEKPVIRELSRRDFDFRVRARLPGAEISKKNPPHYWAGGTKADTGGLEIAACGAAQMHCILVVRNFSNTV
jgi:hypothetical protein